MTAPRFFQQVALLSMLLLRPEAKQIFDSDSESVDFDDDPSLRSVVLKH